jgi:hypothetical protein
MVERSILIVPGWEVSPERFLPLAFGRLALAYLSGQRLCAAITGCGSKTRRIGSTPQRAHAAFINEKRPAFSTPPGWEDAYWVDAENGQLALTPEQWECWLD